MTPQKLNIPLLISKMQAEKNRRPKWFKDSFVKQTAFIEDKTRFKAAHCTRRAGKSYGAALYLIKEAFETPHCSVLYLALNREAAFRILWKDALKDIDRKLNLGSHFSEQRLIMTLKNGSQIFLVGADRQDEMDKLLGSKFKLVVIDEAPKYHIDIHKLVFDILKPSVADYEGTIAMLGTACNFTESYFAKVTRGIISGWSVHKWSALDNPHMKRQFTAEITQLRKTNPKVDDEAWFRQNYLGEWVVDSKVLIYPYTPTNIVSELPTLKGNAKFTYGLGIKVSYTGYSALVVVAYARSHPEVFIIAVKKLPSSDLYAVLEEALKLSQTYDITSVVCVDASAKLAGEIRLRFPLSVHEHSEKDKASLLKVFRAELVENKIKVLQGNADIVYEWDSIIQDDRFKKDIKEHPLCANYISTAALYAWNDCRHYSADLVESNEDPVNAAYIARTEAAILRSQEINDDEY